MFSGIIEELGSVLAIKQDRVNILLSIHCSFTKQLKIDQSISHNGVCLTVTNIEDDFFSVTAIKETIEKSNLGLLNTSDIINLERCVKVGDRLDGHIVHGHVDQTGICKAILETQGSWLFTFQYDTTTGNITVEKGSICVDGVSLTVINSIAGEFSVAIIPYTFNHTNFHKIRVGSLVNLEFDIIGKYVARLVSK